MGNSAKRLIKTISLFSGAGGLDIGFHAAGYDIIRDQLGQVSSLLLFAHSLVTSRFGTPPLLATLKKSQAAHAIF